MKYRHLHFPASVCAALDLLVAEPKVERLILFGSRAVGDNDARADFDIAIGAPGLTRQHFSRLRIAIAEARTLYWISLVHIDQTPYRLKARIAEQGLLIYDRPEAAGQSRQP